MEVAVSHLPNDVEALKALVVSMTQRATDAEAELANAHAKASADQALIAHLKLQIAKLNCERFGPHSERSRRLLDQLELQLEALEASASEDDLAAEMAAAKTTNVAPFERQRPARKAFPELLPRERIVIASPCAASRSILLSKLGEDVTETLEVARAAAQCSAAGKEFVTVDMQTLLALLGLDENDTAFGILAARIGGPHADMRSHLAVVLEVAASIWATNIPHWRKGRAIGRLLTAVAAGLGEQTSSVIVFAERLLRRQSVARGRRPDLAANCIADWRQGHFLAHQSRRPGVLSRKSRGLRS